jgi:hypothetical protein
MPCVKEAAFFSKGYLASVEIKMTIAMQVYFWVL